MGWLKDLEETHLTTKAVLYSMFTVLPFWFMVIVYLKPQWAEIEDIHKGVVLAICCAFPQLIVMNIVSSLFTSYMDDRAETSASEVVNYVFGAIFCITSISYFLNVAIQDKWSFREFIENQFYVAVCLLVGFAILYIVKDIKKMNNKVDGHGKNDHVN